MWEDPEAGLKSGRKLGRLGHVDKGPRRRQSEEGGAANTGIEVSTCYLLR